MGRDILLVDLCCGGCTLLSGPILPCRYDDMDDNNNEELNNNIRINLREFPGTGTMFHVYRMEVD